MDELGNAGNFNHRRMKDVEDIIHKLGIYSGMVDSSESIRPFQNMYFSLSFSLLQPTQLGVCFLPFFLLSLFARKNFFYAKEFLVPLRCIIPRRRKKKSRRRFCF